MKRSHRKRRGIVRVIEVLLAAAALFIAFTTSIFLTSTSRINVLQEHADLDRVGQNTLLRLAESGVIDSTVFSSGNATTFDRSVLQNTITEALPPLTYYYLTIYGDTNSSNFPSFTLQIGNVSNTSQDSFSNTSEVSSSSFMYTSSSGEIYYIVLALARVG